MQTLSKDVLQDIIQYTYGLGIIDLVKIIGTPKETIINAVADNRTVIMTSKFKNPITEFANTFGLPNLGKLKLILGFTDEYTDGSKIEVVQQNGAPSSIHFENKTGDFINDYRLMSKALVDERIKDTAFKGASWSVKFDASIVGIQRLKKQFSVHSEETSFTTTTSNGNLVVDFGDPATHHSNFVFHAGLTGTQRGKLVWPVKEFLAIMDLPGTKSVSIAEGVMGVSIDSGMADYDYYILALAK